MRQKLLLQPLGGKGVIVGLEEEEAAVFPFGFRVVLEDEKTVWVEDGFGCATLRVMGHDRGLDPESHVGPGKGITVFLVRIEELARVNDHRKT